METMMQRRNYPVLRLTQTLTTPFSSWRRNSRSDT